jgi:hypothetical protein
VKITVKPKVETTDQFNIRLPLSLKKRLETLRSRANDLGADFNATLVGVIEEFATELETRFDGQSKSASAGPRANPNNLLGPATPSIAPAVSKNGAETESA